MIFYFKILKIYYIYMLMSILLIYDILYDYILFWTLFLLYFIILLIYDILYYMIIFYYTIKDSSLNLKYWYLTSLNLKYRYFTKYWMNMVLFYIFLGMSMTIIKTVIIYDFNIS